MCGGGGGIAGLNRRSSGLQPLTLNPEPNSIRTPSPLLGNNATLEIIDGVMVIPRIVLIMG